MEKIKELELEKDRVCEALLKWKMLSLLTIVRLKRKRDDIQKQLDKLYQELD